MSAKPWIFGFLFSALIWVLVGFGGYMAASGTEGWLRFGFGFAAGAWLSMVAMVSVYLWCERDDLDEN